MNVLKKLALGAVAVLAVYKSASRKPTVATPTAGNKLIAGAEPKSASRARPAARSAAATKPEPRKAAAARSAPTKPAKARRKSTARRGSATPAKPA